MVSFHLDPPVRCAKVDLKRGTWTPEEDELLTNFITMKGEGKWRTLPKLVGLLRCGKSSRLWWMNYLRPSVKRGHIAPDEEDLILRLHRLLGKSRLDLGGLSFSRLVATEVHIGCYHPIRL